MSNIEDLLPHRSPFLFVDEIERADDEAIVGHHTFTDAEFFFAGHFPEYPVVPGVVLVETMAQVGGAGLRQNGTLGDKLFFLGSIEKAKFRRQVVPGETVRVEVKNLRTSARVVKQSGIAYVGDAVAAQAEWMCVVGDAPA